MENLDLLLDVFLRIAHSPLRNYIIPGLTSSLLSTPGPDGVIRLLHNTRNQLNGVTPHSHRFDFTCLVLRGIVTNRLWRRVNDGDRADYRSDLYAATRLTYQGEPGKYTRDAGEIGVWSFSDTTYQEGEQYRMVSEEVHSIIFGKDAVVLFLEGPYVTDTSIILEPFVDGKVIPTLKVEPWMFLKDRADVNVGD